MTKKTHQAGGMLVSILGFALLKSNNLLLPNVNEGLQWLVIYPFTMWGSTASDLDHHWDSCPSKDFPSRLVNLALHITRPAKKYMDNTLTESNKKHNIIYKLTSFLNASHRSWQTHSDFTLFAMLAILIKIMSGEFVQFSAVDNIIATLILTGLSLGVISHLILDSITPDGIWIMSLVILEKFLKMFNPRINIPKTFRLVPKKSYFATGGKWELSVQKVLNIATKIALVWFFSTLLFPILGEILPFQIQFK